MQSIFVVMKTRIRLGCAVLVTLSSAPSGAQSFLDKAAGVVRVMTWNIGANSIFPSTPAGDTSSAGRPAQFRRVVNALQPDVLCLQEASRGADASAALMDAILPLPDGRHWQAHSILDNVLVSRFDLSQKGGDTVTLNQRRRGHAAALVDLPSPFTGDAYFVCAHFESQAGADRIHLRTLQANAIAERIHNAKASSGAIVLGDMNVVDDVAPYIAVLVNAGLSDVKPRHNGSGVESYTYRDDAGPYAPRALDRIFYSAGNLRIVTSFILNTTMMSYDQLQRVNMRLIDVLRHAATGTHDHLPVVADFAPKPGR
jgi:endonuclease/exonuclease/phosphatase family metal-dependent hydrolase